MDMFANGFSLASILSLLRRRKWIGLSMFVVLLSICASAIAFLPNIYMSQAVILIEGQQIPPEYIRSTVTKVVGRRLQEISQEVLGRSQLEKLSVQFGLYPDLKKQEASGETIAKAMRKDVGISVVNGRGTSGDTVAFSVNYRSPDPAKAMHVTTELASLYISTNMKMREGLSASTSEFLAKQVEEVKVRLEQQENLVTTYKKQHLGELPEQSDANLGMLDALQKQMTLLSDNIARAQERRNSIMQMAAFSTDLETELGELEIPSTAGSENQNSSSAQLSPEQQLKMLQGQVTQLKIRFSDKHPDIIRLKQVIAKLESQIKVATPPTDNIPVMQEDLSADDTLNSLSGTLSTKGTATRLEIATIDSEIQRLNAEMRKASSAMALYQQRIENIPKVEQELLSITRDYNTAKDLYATLLKRLDEAKLADDLEQNQKAEKFKLLEPAFYPDKPAAPDRPRLLFLALFVSLGAAVGGMFLREVLDSSFHDVDALRREIKVPVLITIPRIVTTTELWRGRFRQGIGAVALTLSVLVIVGIMYRTVTGNEQLTRTLLGAGGINQLLLRE